MFHKEGQKIIIITFVLAVAAIIAADSFMEVEWARWAIQLTALVILIAILQFFRNPRRTLRPNFDEITAPVDGKVVVIEEVDEPEYFKEDRKSTRLNSSHVKISYAVFCLKKKKI